MKRQIGRGLRLLVLMAVIALIGTCSVIWARTSAVVNNSFDTGVVRIELRQFEVSEQGREIGVEDDTLTILPGMNISRTSRIYNRGNDCYIRVKPKFSGTGQLDEACLTGIGEDWIRADDGYFYYRNIVPANQSVVFCKGIQIPESFKDEDAGRTIILSIQADAIQSRNITPDIEGELPWGNVEIVKTTAIDGGQVNTLRARSDKKFVIQYQGDVADLIANEENFFGNLPELMPGDEFTDGAKLVNNGNRPIRLYFRSVVEDETDITDKMQLMIETEVDGMSAMIYEGTLRAEELSEDRLLMTIPADGIGKMVFSIFVPPELDNAYVLQNEAIQWIFSTEEIVLPGEGVDTGDGRRMGGYMVLAGLSLGFAIRMIERKRSVNGSTK